MRNAIKICIGSFVLSGCSTLSFAPPSGPEPSAYGENLPDALKLVDDYISLYRQAARDTSNGRRYFEVPAILGAIGAVTATALGAGTEVTIAAGAAGALLGAGKTYFNPESKANVYEDAIDALSCIQQVALGVQPFADANASPKVKALRASAADNVLPAEADQFTAIKNAAILVESYTRKRIRNARADADIGALTAEIEALAKNAKEIEDGAKSEAAAGKTARAQALRAGQTQQSVARQLNDLDGLVVHLQQCVLRAKA